MTQEQADQLQYIYDNINNMIEDSKSLPNISITVSIYTILRNYSGYLWNGASCSATFYIINGVPESYVVNNSPGTSWVQDSGYQSGNYDIKCTLTRLALIDENKNELDIIFAV